MTEASETIDMGAGPRETGVRKGYKRTEVGVIPEEWDTPQLGSILKSTQLGGNYKNSELQTTWPLIKMGNIGRGNITLRKLEFIDKSQHPSSKDMLRKHDIIFNTRNTLELVGKVAIWLDEIPEAYFNSNLMKMEFDETKVSSKRLMNYILNSPRFVKNLREIAIGTTSVAAIYNRDLTKIVVPLPTKAEQQAIAEALSDADALIESLEQLIAKKRQIKQGAMQDLLTGKKRLPGFSGGWEAVKARQIGQFRGGTGFATKFQGNSSGKYPFFKVSDMNNTGNQTFMQTARNYVSGSIRKQLGATVFPTGSIVFAKVGAAIFLERKKILVRESCMDNNMSAFVLDAERADCRFMHYVLLNFKLGELVSTTALPSLNARVLGEIDFMLPVLDEQTAIVAILSDMDAEIAALEDKRAKARQIKQGMMQNLLTGKVRLI